MEAKIGHLRVEIFKIKNRDGYAAICHDHLTEGKTPQQAYDRMCKALRRTNRKDLVDK
ncbi:MAG: hypothetical protein PHG31_04170 [Candidatus Omnitrophica bacterium]|nr:hypothetical protein [Candidatus Omnitrophota bacterium]